MNKSELKQLVKETVKEVLKEQTISVKTPELRKQGRTFSSEYVIKAFEIPEESWAKKAFIVDSMDQVKRVKGIGGIVFYRFKSKRSLSAGGAHDVPDNVYKEMVKLLNKKGKFYAVEIGSKQPESHLSWGDNIYVKGGVLK